MRQLQDPVSGVTKEDFAKLADVKLKNVDDAIATIGRFVTQFGQRLSLEGIITNTASGALTVEDTLEQSAFPVPGEGAAWMLSREVLQPDDHLIMLLRVEHGLTYKEIGLLLGRTTLTVRDAYYRAVKKLRREYEK